jgi:MerR family redox-sensitive transcriptional activator SoxR
MGSSGLECKPGSGHHGRVVDQWHVSGLTVGQVADRMRIARSAVRWYADQDLLPCERGPNNARRFFADVLCRVAMIRSAQRVGLTLDEIREALAVLPPGVAPTPADWERLAARLRETLLERIDELFALLNEMAPAPLDEAGSTECVAQPATNSV